MNTMILPELDGCDNEPRVIHVWFPALEVVRRGPEFSRFPTIAVRDNVSSDKFRLFTQVDINGPSELKNVLDTPLSGTNGRATCLLFTYAELMCYGKGCKFSAFDTPDSIIAQVLKDMQKGT